MATIHEKTNGELNGNQSSTETLSNGKSDISITTNITTTTSTFSTSSASTNVIDSSSDVKHDDVNGNLGSDSHLHSNSNSNSNSQTPKNTGTKPKTTSKIPNGNATQAAVGDYPEDLKIIGHIRCIEKINEKRRVFLNNTVTQETDVQEIETSTTKTELNTNGTLNSDKESSTVQQIFNEKRVQLREEQLIGNANEFRYSMPNSPINQQTNGFKTPTSPPPKPPMLSRSRSFGKTDNHSTPGTTVSPKSPIPPKSPASPISLGSPITLASPISATITPQVMHQVPLATLATPENSSVGDTVSPQSPKKTITSAVASSITLAEPEVVKIKTLPRQMELPTIINRSERPISIPDPPKQISANHYERLVEELKCPGCAYPMKAPILLCQTGHSVCEQCTRVLMLCPLCKEPFTNIRSLTVEALCSKAHFRCSHASGGCTVRLQIELLSWHEKQCIYKPMKCFMGRVWGDCDWSGREAYWKEHLETEHASKVFRTDNMTLIWNMGVKQKPLTGYYVFQVYDEMFNFYEIYDKERVLFTMTCTSIVKDKKNFFAFEVSILHPENEALAITQKFPVHSEYDSDILMEGTCVSIPLGDLAKFIDDDKLLHYNVRVMQVKSPTKTKKRRGVNSCIDLHPIDFQQTQIEGVNLKGVPSSNIVTRKVDENGIPCADNAMTPSSNGTASSCSEEDEFEKLRREYKEKQVNNDSESESDPEFEAFIAKRWGTPQLHFNRKFLKPACSDSSCNDGNARNFRSGSRADSASITTLSYKKRMTNSIRQSFRHFKSELSEMKPFGKKSRKQNAESIKE